jgi:hypothetical protein
MHDIETEETNRFTGCNLHQCVKCTFWHITVTRTNLGINLGLKKVINKMIRLYESPVINVYKVCSLHHANAKLSNRKAVDQ